MKCKTCNHQHASKEPHVCTLLHCTCDESTFEPLEIDSDSAENFLYYQRTVQKLNDMEERIRYMLEHIPGMRNTDDWQFENQYWHYYLNFCTGKPYTTEIYNAIHKEAQPDMITRMRRKICQPDHQAIVILQDEIKDNELTPNHPRYHTIKYEINKIIKESIYLPTDPDLLKKKGIKQDAIIESVLLSST